jgi:Cu(I)/Ag(I) efflux system membrane fusion protein
MNKHRIASLTGFLFVLALGLALGWQTGTRQQANTSASATSDAARKILYWYDPMKPDAHFTQPGKSPFMDMELVPRYADEEAGDNSGMGLLPAFTQNLGVKFAQVEKGILQNAVEVSGSVAFDEHAVAVVQARTGGIVERAYPLAVGDRVRAGVPLVDIRVPEWYAAQSEYLALRDVPQLSAAARARLLQLGMTPAQVTALEKSGQPNAVMTLHAPRAGMLSEIDLHQSMTVAPGQTLARINGIDTVWIEAQVPEAEAASLKVGSEVTVRFTARPTQPVTGHISALIPELQRETRTLRVRVQLPNPENALRPGMYAQIRLEKTGAQAERLLVPTDAIIATGKRHVLIAATEEGRFIPVEVTPGREADNKTEILGGDLSEGERIVVSGQFMIDSEASLRGVLARMTNTDDTRIATPTAAKTHMGTGTVKSATKTEIVLAHDPIPELKWPAMTMAFALATPEIGENFTSGQKVRFHFLDTEEGPVIQGVEAVRENTGE